MALSCNNTQTLSKPSLHLATITASSRRDAVNLLLLAFLLKLLHNFLFDFSNTQYQYSQWTQALFYHTLTKTESSDQNSLHKVQNYL